MTYPDTPGHVAGSKTSAAGAARVAPRAGSQRERVFDHIAAAGHWGVTDEDGTRVLGVRKASYTARRRELELAGKVFDSGRERAGSAGTKVVVWVAFKHMVEPGYVTPAKGKSAGEERYLRRVLLMAAAHCQGGHSDVGQKIAGIFDIPFPIRMEGLEVAAHREGFEPVELWPWLYKMRAEREAHNHEPEEGDF